MADTKESIVVGETELHGVYMKAECISLGKKGPIALMGVITVEGVAR